MASKIPWRLLASSSLRLALPNSWLHASKLSVSGMLSKSAGDAEAPKESWGMRDAALAMAGATANDASAHTKSFSGMVTG